MLHEQEKVGKIVAELTMYFLTLGAGKVSSSVILEGTHGMITFEADYPPEKEDKLKELECLNQQRDNGIEEIYWELAGVGSHGDSSQLLLLGTMIDRAEIFKEEGIVKLTLYKDFYTHQW